jgi:hypothetical protein
MDILDLGPTPAEEKCAQVGQDNYHEVSRREANAYIKQLRRMFGEEPAGARLTMKSYPHDFGSYLEVVVKFNENDEEAVEYAFKLEGNLPGEWDDEARQELQLV